MAVKTKSAASKSSKQAPITRSVTLRVSAAHLNELDRIAEEKGTARAPQIQIAIAEYIKREAK